MYVRLCRASLRGGGGGALAHRIAARTQSLVDFVKYCNDCFDGASVASVAAAAAGAGAQNVWQLAGDEFSPRREYLYKFLLDRCSNLDRLQITQQLCQVPLYLLLLARHQVEWLTSAFYRPLRRTCWGRWSTRRPGPNCRRVWCATRSRF